eukprot:gene24345-32788_t
MGMPLMPPQPPETPIMYLYIHGTFGGSGICTVPGSNFSSAVTTTGDNHLKLNDSVVGRKEERIIRLVFPPN